MVWFAKVEKFYKKKTTITEKFTFEIIGDAKSVQASAIYMLKVVFQVDAMQMEK